MTNIAGALDDTGRTGENRVSTEDERPTIDLSRDPHPGTPDHAAPEGAEVDPLIDLSRDPHPGTPDHAKPDGE